MGLGVLLTLGAWAPAASAVAEGQRIRDNAQEVLADPGYQKSLSREGAPRREPNARPLRYRKLNPGEARPVTPSQGSTVSSTLLWLLVGVVGAAVLFWLGQELIRARQRRDRARSSDGSAADDAAEHQGDVPLDTMPATLQNARRLAAEGRFEDAIHLLLRGAFDYVSALASLTIQPAMTSREVLRQAKLDAGAHRAFGQLVMSVEVSLFGGVPVEAMDFDRCADAYQHLHRQLNP